MRVKSIELVDRGGERLPISLRVEMTIEEALWIARVASIQRGYSPHNGLYSSLVNDVFNRYWDDGIEDAIKDHPFEIPNIPYGD